MLGLVNRGSHPLPPGFKPFIGLTLYHNPKTPIFCGQFALDIQGEFPYTFSHKKGIPINLSAVANTAFSKTFGGGEQ